MNPAEGSVFLVIILLTVRLVADVISGCVVASKLSVSVLVYVVDWLAFSSSCVSTYVVVAFGLADCQPLFWCICW